MKRYRGFTLIELLVVVAIIAILIAILIPSLSKARVITRKTACKANLHGWGVAVSTYASEYGVYMATALSQPPGGGAVAIPDNIWWASNANGEIYISEINKYLSNSFHDTDKTIGKIGICPSIDVAGYADYAHQDWVGAGPFQRFTISYSYYACVDRWPSSEVANQPNDLAKSTIANNSAGRVLMADNVWYHNAYGSWFVNHTIGGSSSGFKTVYPSGSSIPVEGLNRLYIDGHVDWKDYNAADRTAIGNFSYPARASQNGGGYPFFY